MNKSYCHRHPLAMQPVTVKLAIYMYDCSYMTVYYADRALRESKSYYNESTKVLNPRRCIMRVYTREIRMRVHENTHGKMADCTHGHTTEGVLDLCNGAVSEKTPQTF